MCKETMLVLITFLIADASVSLVHSCVYGENRARSSTIRTTAQYMLIGYTFKRQRRNGIFKCAHACLAVNTCLSFNFENTVNGECQLNNKTAVALENSLFYSKRFTYGEIEDRKLSSNFDCEFIFTTLGAKGRRGPTNTHGYNGTNLESSVIILAQIQGLQMWRTPKTAVYAITAYGASGADGTCTNDSVKCNQGGLGAKVTGSFHLEEATMITILVGQQGRLSTKLGSQGGGGGGGSFVVNTEDQLPLIVAGGGGGGGKPVNGFQDGDPGQKSSNGSYCGGFDGRGGQFCSHSGAVITDLLAGSGAGFYGDGIKYPSFCLSAKSFTNGGFGGQGPSSENVGGFGGGGYGMEHGGGGGGYSGGGVVGNSTDGISGGGGSFNAGSSQVNKVGINKGDGRVIIKIL